MRGRCVSGHVVRDTSPKCTDREGLKRRRTGTRLGNALSRSRVTISAGKQDNYPIDFMNINGHSKLKRQGRLLRFELLHFAR